MTLGTALLLFFVGAARSPNRVTRSQMEIPTSGPRVTFSFGFVMAEAAFVTVGTSGRSTPAIENHRGRRKDPPVREIAALHAPGIQWPRPFVKTSTYALFAKSKKKQSFAQRKKRRGRKQASTDRSGSFPPAPTPPVGGSGGENVGGTAGIETTTDSDLSGAEAELEATKSKASQLIETQRRSVAVLTLVRERVEGLDYDAVASALETGDVYVIDNFLNDPIKDKDCGVPKEMIKEGIHMLASDKLQLEEIGSGVYGALIRGGEAGYADSPRCVEFMVSATRHFPPLLNEVMKEKDGESFERLDDSASMGSLKVFDRKLKRAALDLLTGGAGGGTEGDEDEAREGGAYAKKSFRSVTGGDPEDARKVTLVYYLTPDAWNAKCGGGLTVRTIGTGRGEVLERLVEARLDRLVIFSSDECLHREEVWEGCDGKENGGCLVVHLVRRRD